MTESNYSDFELIIMFSDTSQNEEFHFGEEV